MATIRIIVGDRVYITDAFDDFAGALINALEDPDFVLDYPA